MRFIFKNSKKRREKLVNYLYNLAKKCRNVLFIFYQCSQASEFSTAPQKKLLKFNIINC